MATLKELMAKQSPESQQRIAAKAAEIRQSVAFKLASRRVAKCRKQRWLRLWG